MKRTERKTLCNFKKLNNEIDDNYKKLSDKYKNLKQSHKKQEKLLIDFRTVLLAMQNDLNLAICPKCVEEKLRQVNLALGYNQWTSVKEAK